MPFYTWQVCGVEFFQSIFRMETKEHCHSHSTFFHMVKGKPGTGNQHAPGPRPTLVLDLLTLTPLGSHPRFTKVIWNLPVQIWGDPSHVTIDYSVTVGTVLIFNLLIQFYWIFSQTMEKIIPLKKRGDGGRWSDAVLIGPGQGESVKLICLQSGWVGA